MQPNEETPSERSARLKLEYAEGLNSRWIDDKPNREKRRYKNISKINPALAARMLKENPSLAEPLPKKK